MVTGDNIQTARAIALECGILTSEADATEPNIIEGKSFRALSETQREEIAGKISVWSVYLLFPHCNFFCIEKILVLNCWKVVIYCYMYRWWDGRLPVISFSSCKHWERGEML